MKLRVQKWGDALRRGTVDGYVEKNNEIYAIVVWDTDVNQPISHLPLHSLQPIGWFTRSVQHIGAPPDA